MSSDAAAHGGDREHRIREIAYLIWVDEGCPHGRDQEHWAEACDRLAAQENASMIRAKPAKAAKPKAPLTLKKPPAKR